MTAPASHRGRGDDGIAAVESAFALPIALFLLLGLLDFAFYEMKMSQVSSAARDGARVGAVASYATATGSVTGGAPCPGDESDFRNICRSVRSRLAGTTVDAIAVICKRGVTTPSPGTTIDCSSANRGFDVMEVTVTLTHRPLTFVGQTYLGSTVTYTQTSEMGL